MIGHDVFIFAIPLYSCSNVKLLKLKTTGNIRRFIGKFDRLIHSHVTHISRKAHAKLSSLSASRRQEVSTQLPVSMLLKS